MKKVKRRTYIIFALPLVLLLLSVVFTFRWAADGESWAMFPSNQNIFTNGNLSMGEVYDRNEVLLAAPRAQGIEFHAQQDIRRANFHTVGDLSGNIASGVLHAYGSELIGYNLITGTYSRSGMGNRLDLTVDANLNAVAYRALAGRAGAVMVMNYQTGEILVSVSTPVYDPTAPPSDARAEGVYLNRALSSTFTPGSIFKVVTAAAALDTLPDALTRTYTCGGVYVVAGNRVTCLGNHGTINLEQAMGVSCNPFFAQLALDLGGGVMSRYAERFGLTTAHQMGNIRVAAGNVSAWDRNTPELAWTGVGQSDVLVNPLAMTRLMAAIANGGNLTEPHIVSNVSGRLWPYNPSGDGPQVFSSSVANSLSNVLRAAAINHYTGVFGNLPVAGKTGTAEVGEGRAPHAWFSGFLDDPHNPLAFTVIVENGGGGLQAAGSVANTVLRAIVQ